MADPITETLELVRKSQAGDRGALDALFARYYPRVLKVVRLRMGRKIRQRVESADILQETFATAVRLFDRFEMRNEASLINWLSKLAENSIRDTADKVSAQKRDVGREVPLAAPRPGGSTGPADPGIDAGVVVPLDQLVRNEEVAILEACIEALPERYREVLVLRNYVGLSFGEIAEETGRPSEGAARMMHAKAMGELAEAVRRRSGSTGAEGGDASG